MQKYILKLLIVLLLLLQLRVNLDFLQKCVTTLTSGVNDDPNILALPRYCEYK